MYSSIKEWINVPFSYRPFIGRNGAGTKQFSDTVSSLCYPVGDIKAVTNMAGVTIPSTTQLYIAGAEPIKYTDAVIFNNIERPIIRITDYYRCGSIDIRVVYL